MTDRVAMSPAVRIFIALSWLLIAGCTSLKNSETTEPVPAAPKVTSQAAVVEVPPPVDAPAAVEAPAAIPAQPAPTSQTPVAKATAAAPVPSKVVVPKAPPKSPVAVATPPAPAPQVVPKATTVRAAPQAAAAPLDLKSLETRLRATKAIGVLTKLSLKNQVDDLVGKFRAYHKGQGVATLVELRRSYDMLLLKVLSLLQDSDPLLARDIVKSRAAIWHILEDPQKFTESNLMAGATP